MIGINIYYNNTSAELQAAGFSVPQHFFDVYGWSLADNGDGTKTLNFATGGDGARSRGDIQDAVSKGYETEIVYAVNDNWRIAANIANNFGNASGSKVDTLIFSGLVLFVITFAVNFLGRAIAARGQVKG